MKLRIFFILVASIAVIQYVSTAGHEYAYDDQIAILENQDVKDGLAGIPNLFFKEISEKMEDSYGYRPVPQISFALESELFGLNPHVGHVTNIVLYAALCMLVLMTISHLFPEKGNVFAFVVTLLFIVHPVHVEVVANIKSRDELFALGFGLLALNSFFHAYKNDLRIWLIPAFCCTILSFLSKESGFVLCLGIFLLFLLPGKNRKRYLYAALGFFAGLVALRFVVLLLFTTDTTIGSMAGEITHNNAILGNPFLVDHSWYEVIPNSFVILLKYLQIFFTGYPLLYDYGYNQVPLSGFLDYRVVLSAFIHLGLLSLVMLDLRKGRRGPFVFGALFYLMTIAMYLQFPIPAPDFMADRYLFAPSLGLSLVSIAMLSRILEQKWVKINNPFVNQWKYVLIIAPFCIYFSGRTLQRSEAWESSGTLFATDISQLDHCARAHYNYARELIKNQNENPELRTQETRDQILHHFRRSTQEVKKSGITKAGFFPSLLLSQTYRDFGKLDSAEIISAQMTKDYPNYWLPHWKTGEIHYMQGRYGSAAFHLENAKKLNPGHATIYRYLAYSYFYYCDTTSALETMVEPLHKDFKDAEYYKATHELFLSAGQPEIATQYLIRAVDMDPTHQHWFVALLNELTAQNKQEKIPYYAKLAREKSGLQVNFTASLEGE